MDDVAQVTGRRLQTPPGLHSQASVSEVSNVQTNLSKETILTGIKQLVGVCVCVYLLHRSLV